MRFSEEWLTSQQKRLMHGGGQSKKSALVPRRWHEAVVHD
jgi:hypothetical protein